MRVLQVLRAPVGGLYRHVVDLSGELISRGHQVGMAMDMKSMDAQTMVRLEPIRDQLLLGVHDLPTPRLLGPSDFYNPLRLARLASRLRVDILHGHGAKGGFNARLAKLGRRAPAALYTPHGGVLNYDLNTMGGKLFRALEQKLLGTTDSIIFESGFAQQAYISQIAIPQCPAPVIYNGLAAKEFRPVKLASDPYDFVFVGELRIVKGLPFLLDALAPLNRTDGRPATLIIAGGGPLHDHLVSQISKLGLQDRVHLAGVQPARAMFAQGRCAVVPSLAESLPYVILEATASGRPVIATRVGGNNEIFGPTAAALIEAGNTVALRAAMQNFLSDPQAAHAAHEQRLAYVKSTFSIEKMATAIEALYSQCLP